jgi:hypothetical protein
MDKEMILEILREAFTGSRKIEVTLKVGAARAVVHLLWMRSGRTIQVGISNGMLAGFSHAIETGVWAHDNDRVIKVRLMNHFDGEAFIEKLYPHLEGIKVVD